MTEDPPPVNRQRPPPAWLRAVLGALLLAAAGLAALGLADHLSWEEIQARRDALHAWTDQDPVLAPVAFFVLYAVATSFALPIGPPLSVTAGALFGRLPGLVLVSCASTTGASVAFLLSRYLFRDAVERRWGPKLEPIRRGVARDGVYYLLALRLSPLAPFTLVNLGMGLTHLPLRTFWWVSQLGMLPISFCFVNAGVELGHVQSPQDELSPTLIVSLTLVGIVPLTLRLLWERWGRRM